MPGTVLSMQNILLGQTKVMKIRRRETLSHQRAIIHEVCLSSAQLLFSFFGASVTTQVFQEYFKKPLKSEVQKWFQLVIKLQIATSKSALYEV